MHLGRWVLGILGILVVIAVGRDVVATVLTSTPKRRLSPALRYYRVVWSLARRSALRIPDPAARERFLVPFGPASLVGLLAVWVALLVTGWGLIWWGLQSHIEGIDGIWSGIYFSGVTFLTIGYGDIVPLGAGSRMLAVVEGLSGILTTAMVIGLLPTLFSAYARREATVVTLDDLTDEVTSEGLVRAYAAGGDLGPLEDQFERWEQWCADVYDSHRAYPMLVLFRSRRPGASWTTALTIMVETAACVISCVDEGSHHAARRFYRRAVMLCEGVNQQQHVRLGEIDPDSVGLADPFERVHATFVDLGFQVRPIADAIAYQRTLRRDYLRPLLAINEALCAPLKFHPVARSIPEPEAGDAPPDPVVGS